MSAWRRLTHCDDLGVCERIWRAALARLDQAGQLDWSIALLDGSFAPAKNGGDDGGLARNGKGTKWMLVVDGHGLPRTATGVSSGLRSTRFGGAFSVLRIHAGITGIAGVVVGHTDQPPRLSSRSCEGTKNVVPVLAVEKSRMRSYSPAGSPANMLWIIRSMTARSRA